MTMSSGAVVMTQKLTKRHFERKTSSSTRPKNVVKSNQASNNADLLFDAKGSSFRVYYHKAVHETFYLEVRGRLPSGARQKKTQFVADR